MTTYETYYISSNGQPANGVTKHEQLEPALNAWLADSGSLIHGAGGKAVLRELDDEGQETACAYWVEHCEGAYPGGDGWWEDGMRHMARIAAEDGKLTQEKVADYLMSAAADRAYEILNAHNHP